MLGSLPLCGAAPFADLLAAQVHRVVWQAAADREAYLRRELGECLGRASQALLLLENQQADNSEQLRAETTWLCDKLDTLANGNGKALHTKSRPGPFASMAFAEPVDPPTMESNGWDHKVGFAGDGISAQVVQGVAHEHSDSTVGTAYSPGRVRSLPQHIEWQPPKLLQRPAYRLETTGTIESADLPLTRPRSPVGNGPQRLAALVPQPILTQEVEENPLIEGEVSGTRSRLRLSPRGSVRSVDEDFEPLQVWQRFHSVRRSIGYVKPASWRLDTWDAEEFGNGKMRCYRLRSMLFPGHLGRSFWDFIALTLIIYDSIRVPLELFELPDLIVFEVLTWTVRLFWSIDFPLNFFSGFIRSDGLVEIRFQKVLRRYMSTWLIPDIVILAMDWLEVVWSSLSDEASDVGLFRFGKSTRISRSFRALRLVRLFRIFRLGQAISRYSFGLRSEQLVVIFDIGRILVAILALTHMLACLWYGIGNWTSRHGEQTWLRAAGLQDLSLESKYMTCFQWALTQFAGGTDTLTPQNFEERLFSATSLLIGLVAFAIFVSGLTSCLTRLLLISSGPSRQLARLRNFLAQNKVSQRLTVRIQRNARHMVNERIHCLKEDDVELLTLLSVPLRAELYLETRSPVLSAHPFFQHYRDFCPAGMKKLCMDAVSIRSLSPGDILFSRGETPATPEMYFLVEGTMRYSKEGCDAVEVRSGQWAAEATLWTCWTHCGTLSAESNCELMVISAEMFQHIVTSFDTSHINPRSSAFEFVADLNAMRPEQLTDLDFHPPDDIPIRNASSRLSGSGMLGLIKR